MRTASRRLCSAAPSALDRYTELLKRRPMATKVRAAWGLPGRVRHALRAALPPHSVRHLPERPNPPPAARSTSSACCMLGAFAASLLRASRRPPFPGSATSHARCAGSTALLQAGRLTQPPAGGVCHLFWTNQANVCFFHCSCSSRSATSLTCAAWPPSRHSGEWWLGQLSTHGVNAPVFTAPAHSQPRPSLRTRMQHRPHSRPEPMTGHGFLRHGGPDTPDIAAPPPGVYT
eukprot:scaffold12837_cov121-Isochrysis_galbana.AAC.3